MLRKKKILVVNSAAETRFTSDNEFRDNISRAIQISGMNVGNLVFQASVIRELGVSNCVETQFWRIQEMGANHINENFTKVICPCANAFRHNIRYISELNRVLEGVDIPIVIIGIGAEDDLDLSHEGDVKMVEQLKNLTTRSIIGTRGDFTTKVMQKHGITNVMTIGCPSVFSTCNRDFSVGKARTAGKISFNAELGHDTWSPLYYGNLEQFSYFPQNETEEIFMQKDNKFNVSDERRMVVRKLANERLFPNMDVWIHELKKCRFSVGTRFHGNVAAILAGIPALFVSHCQRVKEMIEFFGFPSVEKEKYLDILKTNNYDLSVFEDFLDYSIFNERYPSLYDNFKEFLKLNELKMNDK